MHNYFDNEKVVNLDIKENIKRFHRKIQNLIIEFAY